MVAAGVVVLALAVAVADVRMGGTWDAGVRLALLSAPAAALVVAMGSLTGVERAPRPYVSIILVAGLGLTGLALADLLDALGDEGRLATAAATFAVATVVAALGAVFAARKHSAICTLLACLAGEVALLALADALFALDDRLETFRYLLVACVVVAVVAAAGTRDARRRHAVAFVDAGGSALVALGVTLAAERITAIAPVGPVAGPSPAGWEAVLLLGGWALLAYASVDREPGPAYLGAAALALFAGLAAAPGPEGASLLWWPLVLLVLGTGAVAFGLRPRAELPPEPGSTPAPAPPTPLHTPEPPPRAPSGDPPRPPSPLWAGPSERREDDER